ncbi:MFS transporter [Planotetraspora kaengkrachanensis]|nr:MFS transporter [Planotetraspora kaengkrachanensis]
MSIIESSPPGERTQVAPRARRRTVTLFGISLAYFMVLLDTTVLSVAEPDLAASLHTSTAGLQWATTGYTVVFAALLPSSGAVADRHGVHRVFRAGVAVFGVGSLMCALAPALGILVGLRAVLGVAAAACVPASMAMITRLYPDAAERTRAVATWAATSGAAMAAGPIAGGALVGLAGWRAVFLVNVPIAALVLVLTAGRAVRCPRGHRRIDWAAQAAGCVALALGTDALIAAGGRSWPHAAGSGAAAVLAGAVFVLAERRSPAPVVNRVLLRAEGVGAGLAVGAAVNFTLSGGLFVLPLLLQQEYRLSPIATGLAFLPLTLPFALNPPITGRIVLRFGPRPPILAGMTLMTAGCLVLFCAVRWDAGYVLPAFGLLLTGLGVSSALPALVTAIMGAAPDGTAGAVGGLLNATRQSGATLGVAAMGATISLGTGSTYAFLLAAVVCAASAAWFARGSATTQARPDDGRQ